MKEGWEVKKLGEICKLFADGDWIESKDQSSNGIRLIQTGNISIGYYKDKFDKARYISEDTFNKLHCTEIFEGDCLISRLPDPVGRACILPKSNKRMITAVDCTIVRFDNKKILTMYFNYYSQCENYYIDINKEITGTTRNRISKSKLAEVAIPLPPIAEQHKIVEILDKAFESIDKAKENAEKNLNNTHELFESYLNSLNAEKMPLKTLVDITTGKLDANAATENGQYPFFTCSREIFAINKYAFDCEAILLAGNNAVGDFNVKHYKGKFNAYQRTYVIKINNENLLLYRYLYYQLLKNLNDFKTQSVGANTKFLKIGMIQDFNIALPPIIEQQEIVSKLDILSAETKKLEKIYEQKIADLEELKKSILHKAFNGEITD